MTVAQVGDAESGQVGLVVVAVVGIVVEDKDVDRVARRFADAAHGATDLLAFVQEGHDDGQPPGGGGHVGLLGEGFVRQLADKPQGAFAYGAGLLALLVAAAGGDLTGVEAVVGHDVGQVDEAQAVAEHLDPQVVVLGVDPLFAIAQPGRRVEALGAHHHRGVADAAAVEQVGQVEAPLADVELEQRGADVVAKGRHATTRQVDVGMRLHIGELPRQALGVHHVVGVHAGDVAAPRLVERAVERGHVVVTAPYQPDARVGIRGCDRRAVVLRPVVDDDELEVLERLGQHTVDALAQVRAGVVHRHTDGYGGRGGHDC